MSSQEGTSPAPADKGAQRCNRAPEKAQERNDASLSWADVLAETRRRRASPQPHESDESVENARPTATQRGSKTGDLLSLDPYFALLPKQVDAYVEAVSVGNNRDDDDDERSAEALTKQKKRLTLDTRNALRFGLSCCVQQDTAPDAVRRKADELVGDDDVDKEETDDDHVRRRRRVQHKAVAECDWHVSLCRLLSLRVARDVGDRRARSSSKSRLLSAPDAKGRLCAARLLSNLVTDNVATADRVARTVPVAPSSDEVARRLRRDAAVVVDGPQRRDVATTTTTTTDDPQSLPHENCNDDETIGCSFSWLDMLLASCGQRDVLAAVVASLHNCVASQQQQQQQREEKREQAAVRSLLLHEQVSVSGLVVSTLLRHVLPACAPHPQQQPTEDAATEWIQLLLLQLIRLGHFPRLYRCCDGKERCRGGSSSTADGTAQAASTVVPEQVVLLHCLIKGIEEYAARGKASSSEDGAMTAIFGTEDNGAIAIGYMASVCVQLQRREPVPVCPSICEQDDESAALRRAARTTILDILAETLSADTVVARRIRHDLARKSPHKPSSCVVDVPRLPILLEALLFDLAQLVDVLLARNQTSASTTTGPSSSSIRNFVMEESEQRLITSLVRVIGNLCFQCRQHQDLMRATTIPPFSSSSHADAADDSATSLRHRRTGLHVLLSCTSFAHACFTLREWSIVAIRNVLHKNAENQALVAELEAQQAVQSPALESLGIRLDLK